MFVLFNEPYSYIFKNREKTIGISIGKIHLPITSRKANSQGFSLKRM